MGGSASRRVKRISVLLLLALVAADSLVHAAWWGALREAGAALAEREALDARLARAVRDAAAARTARAEGAAEPGLYLVGESDTIAAASLQGTVLKILEARAATILSAQVRLRDPAERADDAPAPGQAPSPEPGLRRIDLEIAFEARIAEIQAILLRLETGTPAMFVTDLRINPPGPVQEGDPPLHAVLALYAFWRA